MLTQMGLLNAVRGLIQSSNVSEVAFATARGSTDVYVTYRLAVDATLTRNAMDAFQGRLNVLSSKSGWEAVWDSQTMSSTDRGLFVWKFTSVRMQR